MKRMRRRNARIERALQVGRQDRQAAIGLHPLQQIADLDIGVAVVAVLHLAALAEQRVGLVEQQDRAAVFRRVEHAAQVLLGLADIFADDARRGRCGRDRARARCASTSAASVLPVPARAGEQSAAMPSPRDAARRSPSRDRPARAGAHGGDVVKHRDLAAPAAPGRPTGMRLDALRELVEAAARGFARCRPDRRNPVGGRGQLPAFQKSSSAAAPR